MTTNRFSATVLVIAAAALAIATVSFTAAPKAASSLDDYALRHPELQRSAWASVTVNYAGSEYAQNDAEFRSAAPAIDSSDYFLRHPELITAPAVDTSDYFLRHPELLAN